MKMIVSSSWLVATSGALVVVWLLSLDLSLILRFIPWHPTPRLRWERSAAKHEQEGSPSYDRFRLEFSSRKIQRATTNPRELVWRKQLFDANVRFIEKFNGQQHGASHKLAVNEFADWSDKEWEQMVRGWNKRQHDAWKKQQQQLQHQSSQLQSTRQMQRIRNQLQDPVSALPRSVDWRTHPITDQSTATPVKAQGSCGSCWAFATTAALESHLALALDSNASSSLIGVPPLLLELSPQELISCSQNNNQCGGFGGCNGSTAELALEFIAKRGVVEEWQFGYQSYHHPENHTHEVPCRLRVSEELGELHHYPDSKEEKRFYQNAVATVDGHIELPTNNYTALMNAVAKLGPVIVNVAADNWRFYHHGVFVDRGHDIARTDVDHVVVLMGYGTDDQSGLDYWLVRNSFGAQWGEAGYIRLYRVDPATLVSPDADCGMDVRPADGIACTKDNGTDVQPPPVKVCGTSGILFDPVLPVGPRFLSSQPASLPRGNLREVLFVKRKARRVL